MGLSNDERGWILTSLSAIACIVGALVICVDVIIRLFPKGRGFHIQNSNGFLSCSLSLSAGVMLFSSLYSILPSAKSSLLKGGFSSKATAWALIGCFLAGIFGINVLSRIFHHFIPSHVVDCDHTHEDEEANGEEDRDFQSSHGHRHDSHHRRSLPNGQVSENTPLLSEDARGRRESSDMVERSSHSRITTENRADVTPLEFGNYRKPSIQKRVTSTVSRLVSGTKLSCDEDGPCYGYTDPCGQDCFKNTVMRRTSKSRSSGFFAGRPSLGAQRSLSTGYKDSVSAPGQYVDEEAIFEDDGRQFSMSRAKESGNIESRGQGTQVNSDDQDLGGIKRQSTFKTAFETRQESRSTSPTQKSSVSTQPVESSTSRAQQDRVGRNDSQFLGNEPREFHGQAAPYAHSHTHEAGGGQHHHHVPTNAFLSLGLQTSIAIALHKLPEGFITYATNHANPSLGFSVFLALFIHNITEGFALALPLFLATRSRVKALLYTLVLGGLSQPIGAAIAALWLRAAETGRGEYAPGDKSYGIMFALTAGVMTSVGLSLLQEGFELSHNRKAAASFVFLGMGILGISSALTA